MFAPVFMILVGMAIHGLHNHPHRYREPPKIKPFKIRIRRNGKEPSG